MVTNLLGLMASISSNMAKLDKFLVSNGGDMQFPNSFAKALASDVLTIFPLLLVQIMIFLFLDGLDLRKCGFLRRALKH